MDIWGLVFDPKDLGLKDIMEIWRSRNKNTSKELKIPGHQVDTFKLLNIINRMIKGYQAPLKPTKELEDFLGWMLVHPPRNKEISHKKICDSDYSNIRILNR